jgi:hypothetical protein
MKLVRENINEFVRSDDALKNLGIGKRKLIEDWLKKYDITKYEIDEYFEINVFQDVNLFNKKIGNFPEYIQFNYVNGYFNVQCNQMKRLRGCPRKCNGFGCSSNLLTSLEGCPDDIGEHQIFYCYDNLVKFIYSDVRRFCNVFKKIEN